MRCPGLMELVNVVRAREDQIAQLLPAWWTLEERAALVKSLKGRCLIESVLGVVYTELKRIEWEEGDGSRDAIDATNTDEGLGETGWKGGESDRGKVGEEN